MNLPTMAISIRQPWAWAILHLRKNVENRTWSTNFRGPVLIHAGKLFRPDEIRENMLRCIGLASLDVIQALEASFTVEHLKAQTGGIVGMVTIKDCVAESPSRWAEDGRFHWLLADAKPLPFFLCKGRLGLFPVEYPQHLLEAA